MELSLAHRSLHQAPQSDFPCSNSLKLWNCCTFDSNSRIFRFGLGGLGDSPRDEPSTWAVSPVLECLASSYVFAYFRILPHLDADRFRIPVSLRRLKHGNEDSRFGVSAILLVARSALHCTATRLYSRFCTSETLKYLKRAFFPSNCLARGL